jgi:tetratricopeptide (TPR) repeat protein
VVAGVVAAVLGAGMLWRRHAELERLHARLPAMPDVSAQPAALGAAVREAERKALSPRQTLEGVGELGRLYHANGYNREAEACWQILRTEQPQEARWCYYLADLSRTASDDAGMASFLEQTVKLAPDYAPAWLIIAEWEFKTGQLDAAERNYRRRLALLPGDPYASIGLARVALQRDRRDEGRRLIERLVREVPDFAQAHNLYAEMLAEQGDTDGADMQRYLGRVAGRFREADDAWLEQLRAWCYDPSRLALWASIDDMTNHGDHGVALLERAIGIAPDDPRGYDELGKVYLHLSDAAKALTLFEQGTKLPNASAGLYAGISQAYLALNQPEKALQAAKQGLALMPEAPELQTARGIALQTAGKLDEAVEAFRVVVQRAPNVCEAHFNLGSALLQLGRTEEAYVSLKRALELVPTFPKALVLLGQSELKAGRLESAAQYLRPLYRLYPGSVAARRLMPWWCLQTGIAAAHAGHMDEAKRNFREGLEINPDMPELRGRLGLLYLQEGRFAEGRDQLETYHRLQPNEPMASLFLGQVYARLGRTDDARRLLSEGEQLARQSGDKATEEQCAQALQQLSP